MERMAELIQQAHEGDKYARDKLVADNLGLVHAITRRFEHRGHDREEIFQIGCIGLMKAINTFDASKNIKLATYASRCIKNEILMYLRKNSKVRLEVSIDEPLNVDWDGNEFIYGTITQEGNGTILYRWF